MTINSNSKVATIFAMIFWSQHTASFQPSASKVLANVRYNFIMLLLRCSVIYPSSMECRLKSLRMRTNVPWKLAQNWMLLRSNALSKNKMKSMKNLASYWRILRRCSKKRPKLIHNQIFCGSFWQQEVKFQSCSHLREVKLSKLWKWLIWKILLQRSVLKSSKNSSMNLFSWKTSKWSKNNLIITTSLMKPL